MQEQLTAMSLVRVVDIGETLRELRPAKAGCTASPALGSSLFRKVRVPGLAEVISACTIVLWPRFTVQAFRF
jgi:hypothetical protein